ncbi:hypothetical protein Tsp_08534 [Trichinella spiralis]|uniref:hypothetical protein n=1 Tax=Trichinella spiralis TaxID=6334 RepID=UPI0001EFBB51|nr:hypothetical protein Tsp_08534 [Trichinella spiralis]
MKSRSSSLLRKSSTARQTHFRPNTRQTTGEGVEGSSGIGQGSVHWPLPSERGRDADVEGEIAPCPAKGMGHEDRVRFRRKGIRSTAGELARYAHGRGHEGVCDKDRVQNVPKEITAHQMERRWPHHVVASSASVSDQLPDT